MNENEAVVLVADDSLLVRTLLRRQLEEQGHHVIEAMDGEEALQRCLEKAPDVILLDVEMPKLDGHGVLRALQADPSLAEIPVVFLTARTTTEDVVEGLRLGAHDYLCKPFEPAELVARVSAAIRVKSLQDELRHRNNELAAMSNTDSLTSLPNRRYLQQHLLTASSLAAREQTEVSVLMVDIDRFKQVNDKFGHEVGDVVLCEVASRLAFACESGDIAGRWGGEEFIVISNKGRTGATELAERIRTRVMRDPVHLRDGSDVDVTVSIGVGSDEQEGDALLRAADAALYTAKASGRNRVVF